MRLFPAKKGHSKWPSKLSQFGITVTVDLGPWNWPWKNQDYQIHGVYRLGMTWPSIWHWWIKSEILNVNLQFYDLQNTPCWKIMSQRSKSSNLVNLYVNMLVLSRSIKICNHIPSFWPFSMSKGQVWRPFWKSFWQEAM